jgi:hypothetical protein
VFLFFLAPGCDIANAWRKIKKLEKLSVSHLPQKKANMHFDWMYPSPSMDHKSALNTTTLSLSVMVLRDQVQDRLLLPPFSDRFRDTLILPQNHHLVKVTRRRSAIPVHF